MGMQQSLLTTSMITREAARLLSNNLVLSKSVNRDYDSDFGVKGAKIGQTVNIRMPIRPHGRVGPVIDPNAVQERYLPLSFAQPIGVDYVFNSVEMTLAIDDFSTRYLKPAMVSLSNLIESTGYAVLLGHSGQTVGSPGTALTSANASDAVLQAVAKLYDAGAPIGDGLLTEINTPQFNALLAGGSSKLFNPTGEISEIYRSGLQGTFGGADHFVSQLVGARHTNGVVAGTPRVNGAGQTGNTLVTDGWTAGDSLNVGDSFTIDGVTSVNQWTYVNSGQLQSFTVTAKSVTAAGASTLSISPAIDVGPGGYQNVNASPADNAALTVLGASGASYSQAVVFHRDSLILASVDLDLPPSQGRADYVRDPDTGIGVRCVQDYDIRNDQFITRFDAFIAWGSLYPQLSVRIITA